MASDGSGSKGTGKAPFDRDKNPSPNVSDLLQRLNLTKEEGAVVEFSDDEDMRGPPSDGLGSGGEGSIPHGCAC